jgi:copper chaperone CopZ
METTLKISGMSCEMCVRHVTNALQNIPGVTKADVDLQSGTALVEHQNASIEAMRNAVAEEGYEAQTT